MLCPFLAHSDDTAVDDSNDDDDSDDVDVDESGGDGVCYSDGDDCYDNDDVNYNRDDKTDMDDDSNDKATMLMMAILALTAIIIFRYPD